MYKEYFFKSPMMDIRHDHSYLAEASLSSLFSLILIKIGVINIQFCSFFK